MFIRKLGRRYELRLYLISFGKDYEQVSISVSRKFVIPINSLFQRGILCLIHVSQGSRLNEYASYSYWMSSVHLIV